MKMKWGLLFVTVWLCPLGMALSPPQYGLWRQIHSSIGASSCVEVKEIVEQDGTNFIDVIGCDAEVCQGLALILNSQYNFGGIEVTVRVFDPDGVQYSFPILQESEDVVALVKTGFQNALRGNPHFNRLIEEESFLGNSFWVEWKPDIIQFWNDNIGDYYGNNNYVVSDVFSEVCKSQFEFVTGTGIVQATVRVGYTIAPVKNESRADAFQNYP